MPLKRASLVILLIALALLLAGCAENSGKVTGKEMVYYFFSPQCPHCEKVKPYVENASKKIEIEFCQVEKMSEECKDVAKKIGLKGVPTAVYKKEGELKVYVGEIQVRNFMQKVIEGS